MRCGGFTFHSVFKSRFKVFLMDDWAQAEVKVLQVEVTG